MSTKTLHFAAALLILGGLVGYYIYYSETKGDFITPQPAVSAGDVDQVNENIGDIPGVAQEVSVNDRTNGVENKTATPIPNLNRPINISSPVLTTFEKEAIDRIRGVITLLKQDPNLFNEWVDLGLLWKSIEDYEGAREAWEYAGAIRPQNSLSFYNLGVLYAYYLNDQARAEANFLRAVENSPALDYLYPQIVDFYLEVVRSKEKAKAFLNRSMVARPDSEVIKTLLGNLGV